MNPTPTVPGSHFAGAAAARRAIELVQPTVDALMPDRRVCGGGFLAVVVMDPARPAGSATFDDAVLLEHSVGDRARWDADYLGFARAKARLAWTHGTDAHAVQSLRPHLLREGDSLLWGSVWLDGIAVGVSGAEAWYDEFFGTAIAAALRAVAKEAHAAAVGARALVAGAQGRGG